MRFPTNLLLVASTFFALTGCGGLRSGDEDTGPMFVPESGDDLTPTEGVAANDYDGDCIADTNMDGVFCGVGDVGVDGFYDPIVMIQPGTVEESSVPLVCAHQSLFVSTSDTCFDGWGTGVEESWTGCVIDADYATFNGERYQCAPLTDNGDEYRGNFRNSEQSYCADPEDPDYDSFACWANLTGNARSDDFVVRNDSGDYAIAVIVEQNYAYPGSGDGTGAE